MGVTRADIIILFSGVAGLFGLGLQHNLQTAIGLAVTAILVSIFCIVMNENWVDYPPPQ